MTRRLPWEARSALRTPESRTAPSRDRRHHAAESTPIRIGKNGSLEGGGIKPTEYRSSLNATSSPHQTLPEAPIESFMEEGLDNDDRFRMVEDEFLSIAKKFTANLHAAEYQRQQRLVKSLNSEAISTISRPVSGIMPKATKRKLKSLSRAKAQRDILQGMVPHGSLSEHSSDDGVDVDVYDLPYIGTSLHGLMDSPRKRQTSLAKLGLANSTTRSAAGFDIPTSRSSPKERRKPLSPKLFPSKSFHKSKLPEDESTASDDDFDLVIPATKLETHRSNVEAQTTQTGLIPISSIKPVVEGTQTIKKPTESSYRVRKRLEEARLRQSKREQDTNKESADLIPAFL